jgi:dihydroflavonol-4-reductase
MKTLVTGGAGFIGSNVVKHLLNRNEEVRVLHLPNEKLDNLKGLKVELVAGNVLNKSDIQKAIQGCDKVYHLAAIYALWMPNPRVMMDVNIEGSRNVFDVCLENNIEKVVYTSSLVCYAGQGRGKVCNEESPFKLGDSGDQYSKSKFKSHQLAEQYANEKNLNITIVCPSLPIGPGDIGPTPTGKYLKYSLTAPALTATNDIINAGDVRDIAYGHLLAMEKGKKGRSYILGNTQNISMEDLLTLCLKINGRKIPLIKTPDAAMRLIGLGMQLNSIFITRKAPLLTYEAVVANQMGLAADCSRAVNELGYSCRPLKDSIKDALDWFKEQE